MYYLVHIFGGVQLSLDSQGHKSYGELVVAARDFVRDGNYNAGYDSLHWIKIAGGEATGGDFLSSELEDFDE